MSPFRFPSACRLMGMALAIGALAAAVGTADTAAAASISISTASGIDVAPPGDAHGFSSNQAADLATAHLATSATTAYGSSSSGSTEAAAGVIRMYSTSSVVNPLANGLTGASDRITAQTNNLASLTETVQVVSATLADGAPVDLLFGLSFSQSLSSSEPLSIFLDGGYEAKFFAHDQTASPTLMLYSDGTTSAVMHTFVGQTVSLFETMFGGTMATYIDQTAKSITDDATHSAHFYIDAQSPGVTLLAESGHDYGSTAIAPVPEPSELALLLSGFTLTAGVRQWRRRAASDSARQSRVG